MKKKNTVLCLGDSFTNGFGVKKEIRWVYKTNIPDTNLINGGINGDTTSGMLSRLKYHISEFSPNFVLITGGINDFISGSDTSIPQNNYMSMIHQAAAFKVFPIIGIAPSFNPLSIRNDWSKFCDFKEVEKKQMQFNQWLHSFAQTFNIPCIDFYENLNRLSVDTGEYTTKNLYIDGIHLNSKGHEIIVSITEKYLRKLLNI